MTSVSPRAYSNSQIRLKNLLKREKRDLYEARQSLPNVLAQVHKERDRESPTRNYLVTKAGQLMQKALMYRQIAGGVASGDDPRDRLRGGTRK